jgi:hypothetical protein
MNLLTSPPAEFERQQLRELKAKMWHTVIVLAALASVPLAGFIISLRSENSLPQGLWLSLSCFCVLLSIGSGLRLVNLFKQRNACLSRSSRETSAMEETDAPAADEEVRALPDLSRFHNPFVAEFNTAELEQARFLSAQPHQSSRSSRRRRSIPDARSGRACHKAGGGKFHSRIPRRLLPKVRLPR